MSRNLLNARRFSKFFLVLLILSAAALIWACENTDPSGSSTETPGEEIREGLGPLELSEEEKALYALMTADSSLDAVTEAWQQALKATEDPAVKDQIGRASCRERV